MKRIKVISVDVQKDFSSPGGIAYRPRPCVDFIKEELTPYFRQHGFTMAEIVSDYRLPRPGDACECCVPGTLGYESEIPADIKDEAIWIKCMNSPVWTRDHAGCADTQPGLPYPDPNAFSQWLSQTVGPPHELHAVVVIGLTLDCCVLCTGQELSFRAYPVRFLFEGVDPYSGDPQEKSRLMDSPLSNWGEAIRWEAFQHMVTSTTVMS